MLQLLRDNYDEAHIKLTENFRRDLSWFAKFLHLYNGTSIYDHPVIRDTLELDACLDGMGGVCGQYVYHIPIERGYGGLNIAHLEMVNILVALRVFSSIWTRKKLLIKCDNAAVVQVLTTGRAQDPFLGACARNIWFHAALIDVDVKYVHVLGVDNVIADLLSRWGHTHENHEALNRLVDNPIWVPVSHDML